MKIRATLMLFLLASFTYILNAQDFTTTISISASDPTNTSPIPVTITFGASVSDFVEGEITVGNGTVTASSFGEIAPNDGTTYGATITPDADGTVTVDVAAGVATNGGDQNLAATQSSVEYDSQNPTATITRKTPVDATTNATSLVFNVLFSESVSNVTSDDFTVNITSGSFSSSAITDVSASSGTSIDVTLGAVTGNGDLQLDLNGGTDISDAAGNNPEATGGESYAVDQAVPTATITRKTPVDATTNATSLVFNVLFSESVSNVTSDDFTVNITSGSFSSSAITDVSASSGTSIDVTLGAVTGNGDLQLDLNGGTDISDAAGNNPVATGGESYAVDQAVPTAIITRKTPVDATTNATSLVFNVLFSESVSNVTSDDFTVNITSGSFSSSAITNVSASSGTSIDVTLGTVTGNGDLQLDLNGGTDISDAVGNNPVATGGESYAVNQTVPTATITRKTPVDATTNATSLVFNVLFSESVSNVTSDDFTVNITSGSFSSSAITNVSASSGTSIDVTLGTITGNGDLQLDLNGGTDISDAAGNNPVATGGESYAVDQAVPTATITRKTPVDATTNATSLVFNVLFSESVSNVTSDDFTVNITSGSFSSSAITNVSASSGTSIDVTLGTVTGNGDLQLDLNGGTDISDAVGNKPVATSGESYEVDQTIPTVVISSLAGDPTNVSPVPFTVQFSEGVSGFTLSDIDVTATETSGTGGSTITEQNFVATDADTYTFEVAVTYNVATISVKIFSGVCTDDASNQNDAASEFSIHYDNSPPTPTISSTESSPSNAAAIPVIVDFNEDIKNFEETDLDFNNGTSSNFTEVVNKRQYKFDVTPTADGVVTVDIDAGVCTDLPNNNNLAAAQFTITSDQTKPTPTISSATADPTNTGFEITVTFDEAVAGFDLSDISVSNATAGNFQTVTPGMEFTADISPSAQGVVSVDISADLAADAAGNFNNAALQLSTTFDDVSPTVEVSSTATNPTNLSAIPFTITFSEPVNNFTLSDISISGVGSASDFSGADDSYAFNFTPSADGTVTVTINAGVCSDNATNSNDASAAYLRVSDRTIPEMNAVGIESDNNHPDFVGVGGTVTLTFTGSENLDMSSANVTIVGQPASVSGSGKNWTATYTMQTGDPTNVAFNIANYNDIAGNTGTPEWEATDGSTVTFVETPPSLTSVSILSDNSNDPSYAKPGDVVTINFTSDEGLENVTAKIGVEAKSMVVESSSAKVWMAEYSLPGSGVSEGILPISISFRDYAGNQATHASGTTDGSSVTFDKTAPDKPLNLKLETDLGLSSSDNITSSTNPQFYGEAEAFSTIKIYSNVDDYLGSVSATGTGTFYINSVLSEGNHSITATAIDATGNTSMLSEALTVTIDNTAPAKPATPDLNAGSDTGNSDTDNITSNNAPAFAGTAETNSRVRVYVNGIEDGNTTANIFGVWNYTISAKADGTHTVSVIVTDVAGNDSPESDALTVIIDTSDPPEPGAPDMSDASDTGISTLDNNTRNTTPVFTGSAEAGSTVRLYSDKVGLVGSGLVDGGGEWSISSNGLTVNTHDMTVKATDLAGNESDPSAALSITIDNTLPPQPSAPDLKSADDLGISDTDDITSLMTPTIDGTAEANSYVHIYVDNVLKTTQIVSAAGNYSYTFDPPLADDTYAIRALCEDPAGNSSVTSDNLLLTIDNVVPVLSVVKISSDNDKSNYAKTGETVTLNINSSEEIKDPDITIDGKPTSLSGGPQIWTCTRTLDGTETQGALNFLIEFEDLAGNPGIDVNSTTDGSSVIFDKEAPVLTDISISSDHTNSDKARIGSEVNIRFSTSALEEIEIKSVKINGKNAILNETSANNWTATGYMSPDAPTGTINFTIDYEDLAGNAGVQRTSTTDGTEVVFDKTLPLYNSVTIYSDNVNPSYAVDGNTVFLDFETNEAIETPTVFINGIVPDEITGGPISWSAKRVISTGENEGVVPFSIDIADLAGNTPAVKFSTTDMTSVTFDDTEPGISSVTVSAGIYTVGDVIAVSINADDVAYSGTTVKVNGKDQVLINSMNNNYRIDYLIEEGDDELFDQGSIPVNIVFEDSAGLTTSRTNATVLNGTITIDASIPRINSFASNAESDDNAIIGDSIVFTLVPMNAEMGLNISPSYYNGKPLNWNTTDGSEYTGTYVVQKGDPEQESPLQPDEIILYDDAGNGDTITYTSVAEKIFTEAPTAAISGTTTKCDYGQTVPVTFKFTGRKPFSLTYNNGSENVGPLQIDAYTHVINVESGQYTLVNLTDSTGNYIASATENATVTVLDLPEISTNYSNSPYSLQSEPDELSQYVQETDKRDGVFSGDGVGYQAGKYFFYPDNIPGDLYDQDVEIVYTYTDAVTGCFNKDTNTVFVSSTPVVIKNLDAVYCEYGSTDILKGQLPAAHTGLFEIFDADSIPYTQGWIQNDSITLTLDPTGFEPGEYIIVYSALKYPELTETSYNDHKRFIVEASLTGIGFEELKTEYCFDQDNNNGIPINIDIDPENGSVPHYMTDQGSYFSFNGHTGIFKIKDAEAENSYTFSYVYESPAGCMSDTVTHSIYINLLPDLSFSLDDNYNFDNGNIPLTGTPYLPDNPDYYFTGPYVNDNQLKPDDSWVDREILITYHGTDENGCPNEISHATYIYKSAFDTIKGLNEDGIYCYSDEVIDLSVKFKDRDVIDESVLTGTFRSNHGALKDLGDNKAQYFIDSLGSGYDTIHFDYVINATPYSIQRTIYVDSIGKAILVSSTDDFDFCAFETDVDLTSNIRLKGEDFFEFNGSTIDTSTTNDQFTFDPAALVPDQTYSLDYTFTSENNCKVSTSEVITIHPVPEVDFTQPEQCFLADEDIQFTNLTTFEEGDIQDLSWQWSLEGAVYTPRDVEYAFKGEGPKTVVLTATTRDNCSVSASKIVTIGNTANANFEWNIECLTGDSIQFENRSTGGNVNNGTYQWFINDDLISDDMNLKYLFGETGSYEIKLDFVSTDKCKDNITKSLFIQPYIRIKAELEDEIYLEDFEGSNTNYLWSHRPTEEMLQDENQENDTSRWSLGNPDGAVISYPASGENAWFTNIKDISVQEQSEVMSPCFDFTGLNKPMIKMDIWSSSEFPRDGATLQYSTDQGVNWNYLGNQGEGINWFNSNNVLSFDLGDELVRGWNQEQMTNWRSARHNLDALANQPNVRFRIVYAADGNNAYPVDGFAFDNVFIGDRQQQVLSEYFTNVESDSYEEGKAQVNALFAAKDHDIVSINYHTGDPEGDPMYNEYKEGPSARVYYYGITSVPYIIATGTIRSGITSDAEQTSLESKVDIESLNDPKLAISATLTSTKGDFTITAMDDLDGTKLFLFLAVVKDSVESENKVYYNVLRDFLPDPAGVKIESSGFVTGKSVNKTVSFSNVDKARFIGSSLVVFVQNAETKEIYQVVSYDLDNVLDGIWEHAIADVDVYPNPASNIIFIDSESEIENLIIIDLMGRVVAHLKPGSSRISVPIEDLKDGIYFIRGKTTRGEFIEKVVVR